MRIYENYLLDKESLIKSPSAAPDQEEQYLMIEYKLQDVCKFIDGLQDLGFMSWNERAFGYSAHGKAWFLAKIHAYLRRLAQ